MNWNRPHSNRLEEMGCFHLDDIGSLIHNKAIERIISPMTVQLCHLIISMERTDVEDEVFVSLEKMAEELARVSEEFVQATERLAGDSEEKWLREEMGPAAESLLLSGRDVVLVARKLHLQPGSQHYREKLVTTAQQILLDTTKVLLLEDAATARMMVRAAGWCLTCLDALEAEQAAASLRSTCADLAVALLRLGGLVAWRPGERLGGASCLLRGCVPELLAAARSQLRHPGDPQLAASRRQIFARTRKTLGEFLVQLEPAAAAPMAKARSGALVWRLRQLHKLLAGPGPDRLRYGSLDAPLAAVIWHSMQVAACSAPPARLRLVACCRQLLELRSAVGRQEWMDGPPGTGERSLELRPECAALWAAAEALSQAVQTGLLRQILDTFTDTQSPLQSLLGAALGTLLYHDEGLPNSLQLFLAAFHDHAKRMLRVAYLVLVCCPRQETGQDLEAAMGRLSRLVARVQQLFSPSHQASGLNWSPEALQALFQAWAAASGVLLACFDDVLNIPEFLSVSIQDMTEHLGFSTWALKRGDSSEFSRHMAYLQGRATHIVQVMSRYVDQDRDPIFRNGLWVLIQQLEQSSLVLRGTAELCTGDGYSLQDHSTFVMMAKRLVDAAQGVREGLDGTNHPDILSPLRNQVRRFDIAKGQHYFGVLGHQNFIATKLEQLWGPGLGKSDPGNSYPSVDHPPCSCVPDALPERRDSLLPISEAILATGHGDHQAGTSACGSRLQQDMAVEIAQGTLVGYGPLGSERTTGPQDICTLSPSVTDLSKEIAYCTAARNDKLLEVALGLCGRTGETRQALVAMAGDWYLLCQQLFCHIPAADLAESRAVFTELQQNLATMVQLAAKSGPKDLGKELLDSSGNLEALQDRLAEVESHAKELLDKAGASDGLQASNSQRESIEDVCLLWSLAVQDLLQCVERFSGRQGLFLLHLRRAVEHAQGLQEGLAQAAEVSQRLHEAARLTSLLCGDEQVKDEIGFLSREIQVLTSALLDVTHILASSPKPSPSLFMRFELVCWELTLRAKALTGHLSSINADYERAFQDAICSKLSACKDPQAGLQGSLESMMSGIQAVQEIVVEDQEFGPCQEGLLVALESVLVLTREMAQGVAVFREHSEARGLHVLDWFQWEWAAKAHYAVAQLQVWRGSHTKAWRLLVQCLKSSDELAKAAGHNPVQVPLHCEEDIAGRTTVAGSVDAQGAAPGDTPGSSLGTCTVEPASTGTQATTENLDTQQQLSGAPSSSDGHRLTRLPAEPQQPPRKDGSTAGGNRITQITREMAKEVFLMAQSLRRRGRVLTKDQLITSARKIAISGQQFAKLMRIIAKNCKDQRCSQELLCVVEQIQTMSSQLHIISSVKASLARSKSSEELLVENAQQLLRAVSRTLRAAEAASLRGLKPPSSDPEELEVTALCMQWRRKLLRHRLRGNSGLDCDELGLRKTGSNKAPTLSALVEEVL